MKPSIKHITLILSSIILSGCSSMCDCKYVKTESNPTTNYTWKQTFIDKWDASCSNEQLSNSTYTDSQGRKWYSKTKIVCK
jgi:uncharacterized protein YceK